jgi:TolA-binding protein
VDERYVLWFLNAYSKGDAAGLEFLRNAPKADGVPAHLLSVEVHRAEGGPPTLMTLASEFAKHDYTGVAEVYRSMVKEAPTFKPAERGLISWGEPFLDAHRYAQAIDIYGLVHTLYPDSPRAAFYLALAYDRNQYRTQAIEHY